MFPLIGAASLVESAVHLDFGPSSASLAEAAKPTIQKIQDMAMAGNLAAARALADRSQTVGVASERAVWAPYFNAVQAAHPEWVQESYTAVPPGLFQGTVQQAAEAALAHAVLVPGANTALAQPSAAAINATAPASTGVLTPLLKALGIDTVATNAANAAGAAAGNALGKQAISGIVVLGIVGIGLLLVLKVLRH